MWRPVDNGDQVVQLAQAGTHLSLGDQPLFQSLGQLVQIHDMHPSIGIEDNVSQQIRDDQGIIFRSGSIFHNIAVPVQQRTVMAVELADLEAFLEIIAGTAVGKRGLGIQGLPFGQNVVFVLLDDNIIL